MALHSQIAQFNLILSFFFFSFFFLTLDVSCDHGRAVEYYIESVQNKCEWKAYPCSSYQLFKLGRCKKCKGECPSMGYDADRTKQTGKHYLKTNSKAPFCGRLRNLSHY